MMFRRLLSTIELYKNAFLIAHETLQVCHRKKSWICAIKQLDCGSHIVRCIDPRNGKMAKAFSLEDTEDHHRYLITCEKSIDPHPACAYVRCAYCDCPKEEED